MRKIFDYSTGAWNYDKQYFKLDPEVTPVPVYDFGDWTSIITYKRGAMVTRLGARYICIQDSIGNAPNVSPAYWEALEGGGGDCDLYRSSVDG